VLIFKQSRGKNLYPAQRIVIIRDCGQFCQEKRCVFEIKKRRRNFERGLLSHEKNPRFILSPAAA
jgi:hypothetical protein